MKTTWDRIHVWLTAHAAFLLESLRPGASDERILRAEQTLGVTFSEDVRAAYRSHDGQREGAALIEGFTWLPLEKVEEVWRVYQEMLEADQFPCPQSYDWLGQEMVSLVHDVDDAWWNTAWIPLTEDGNGNAHYLDLSPANGGRIVRWNEGDWAVVAPSFRDWLETFADDVERGVYRVEDYGLSLP